MAFVLFHAAIFSLAAVVAYGAGAAATPALSHLPGPERVALRIAAGLAVLAFLFFGLALAGRLDGLSISVIASAGAAVALVDAARRRRALPRWRPDATVVVALLALAAAFALTLYPPTAFDETLYHLPTVRGFAESGRMPFLAWIRTPVFPNAFEALEVPLSLAGGDTMTHLLPLLASGATAVLVFSAAADAAGAPAGTLALALFLSSPIVVALATTGYVESLLVLFVAAGLRSLERFARGEGSRWAAWSGVFAGSAAAVKYLGLFWCAALAVGVLALGRRRRLPALGLFGVGALVALLPWYARIVFHTGNPLFPFLPGVFGHTAWDPFPIPPAGGPARAIADLVRIPWDAVFVRQKMNLQPPLSPWFLAGIPLLAITAFRDRRARAALALMAAWAVVWLALPRDARYLTVLLPLASVEIARAAAPFVSGGRRRTVGAFAAILLLPGLLYAAYRLAVQGPVPTDAAARDRYLAPRVPGYRSVAFLNGIATPRDVAFGCGGEQLAAYFRGRLIGDLAGIARYDRLLALADTAAIARALDRLGARYVIVVPARCRTSLFDGPGATVWYETLYSDGESSVFARTGAAGPSARSGGGELFDLGAMGAVVLGHQARNVGKRDDPDAFLRPRSLPRGGGAPGEPVEVLLARAAEGREPLGEIERRVVPLAGDPVAVEVRKERGVLLRQKPDSAAEPLSLEIGEVPDVLEERETVRRRLPPDGCPQAFGAAFQVPRHFGERRRDECGVGHGRRLSPILRGVGMMRR